MKTTDRLKNYRKLFTFLATPVRDNTGRFLRDKNGAFVYPTLREAADEFGWSEVHISRLRSKKRPEFETLKNEITAQYSHEI